jgi:CubicO group peptidase (beta-lactamase class C family)
MRQSKDWLSFALLGSLAFVSDANGAATTGQCPPLGPVLPISRSPNSDPTVMSAAAVVSAKFQAITSNLASTALSIGVQSIHEDLPLLDLHFTPRIADSRSTTLVNAETVYRIGSVSKLFTALAALQVAEINMDDPVTKYVPQLRDLRNQQAEVNEMTVVSWDDVTVGSLATHLAGFASESMYLPLLPLLLE